MGTRLTTTTRYTFAGLLAVALATTGIVLRGADHADAPDTSERNLDINDVYAFVKGDDIVLIMTVSPLLTPGEMTENAALNPRGLYEFKLDRERDGVADAVIQIATAGLGSSQTVTVRGPVAPETTGTTSRVIPGPALRGKFGDVLSGDGMMAWAGPSDDPFYINLFGDRSLTSVLNAAYGAALGMQIGSPTEQSLEFENPAADDLAGLNTLSIVVQIPKAMIAQALGIPVNGSFFIWGATSVR
jgi:hypothetical protein